MAAGDFVRLSGPVTSKAAGSSLAISVHASGHAAGNTVVVGASHTNAGTLASVSDSKGNTYTEILNDTATSPRAGMWYSALDTALVSGDTITVTYGTAQNRGQVHMAAEFEGAGSLDSPGVSATGSSGTPSSGNKTPAAAPALAVGWIAAGGEGGDLAVDGSWTLVGYASSGTAGAASTNVEAMMERQALSTTDPVAATGTISSTSWWAGIAVFTFGVPPNDGAVTGSIAWVGSVTGEREPKATADGAIGWVGSVSGTTVRSGSTSGSIAWVGTVDGEAPLIVQDGEVLGSIGWVGTVTGTTERSGDASGSLTWAGTVTGATTHSGSVAGAVDWSGSVTGTADHEGTAAGAVDWVGSVTGESPSVGQQDGSVSGAIDWVGAVTGEATHEGSVTGSVAWVGSVVGESPDADVSEGAVFGSVNWVGTVDGSTITEGSVAGAIDWTGTVTGQFPTARTRLEGRSMSGFGAEGSPSGVGLEGTRL
jgi:hypothetical protein